MERTSEASLVIFETDKLTYVDKSLEKLRLNISKQWYRFINVENNRENLRTFEKISENVEKCWKKRGDFRKTQERWKSCKKKTKKSWLKMCNSFPNFRKYLLKDSVLHNF